VSYRNLLFPIESRDTSHKIWQKFICSDDKAADDLRLQCRVAKGASICPVVL
jgi:hypothetical protein